jgi:putative ABC transport system permease protein
MKNNVNPPRLFHRFFRWYCRPAIRDHIEGDLIELYSERAEALGKRKADIKFIVDVLLLFRPGIIRPYKRRKYINRNVMIKSNIRIGWRRLLRHKGYSIINIGGLAIGMTVAIFIGLWIYDELSFNRYHKNHDSISQVWAGENDPATGEIKGGYSLQYPVGATLKTEYGRYFKHVLMAWHTGDFTISTPENKFERKGQFIEGGALDMLSLKMLQGSWKSLDNPNSIVLSRSTALAIFGEESAVGRTLRIDNRMEAKVTGVYADIPRNNRFGEVQFFAPWPLWVSVNEWAKKSETDWDNRPFIIYTQLRPGVTTESANRVMKDLYTKNMPSDYFSTVKERKPFVQLVPMGSWHLYAEFDEGKPAGGRILFVWLFAVIGIFVLLLACINFINLSTARSEKRAREVGVRKAVGSGKRQLVFQFLTESFLVVFLAFLVSILILLSLNGGFNELSDKDISLPFNKPYFWIISLVFILFTGLMAGIYPAFYLSSFEPVKVLKGVWRHGQFAALPRKVLVIVQFTVSVVLIIGTLIIYKQVHFARNRPVGYDRQNLITVSLNDPAYTGKLQLVKTELLNSGVVASVGGASSPITEIWNTTGGYKWPGQDPDMDAEFVNCNITPGFGKTVGWQVIAGRDFSENFQTDTTDAVIINEAAAKYMGLTTAVGQKLTDVDEFGKPKWSKEIIGVVKDVIMGSPYEPVKQTIYYYRDNYIRQLHIKIKGEISAANALAKIKEALAAVAPAALFNYKFVDEEYAAKFGQEERIGKLAGVFAILAIFISCMGLSGLASFVVEQRTKEIGIRKVMGASVSNLWGMLSKDFVVLVIISCLIAIPICYFIMRGWLQKYEYHTNIPWWIFAATALAAILITMLTVSFQSIRASLLNPVKSLRSE